MYEFAVIALLGLAVLKVAELVEEFVPGLVRFHTFLTFLLGITAVVAADYSIFAGYHIPLREAWMGTWATGLIVGSIASAWRVLLGFLTPSETGRITTGRNERPRVAA
jgi:glutamate synthase domain-containing protein 1